MAISNNEILNQKFMNLHGIIVRIDDIVIRHSKYILI